MSIEETKKTRRGRGENKTYFHYSVYDNETDTSKYYKTTSDIAKVYGCSRGTIYSIINSPEKSRRIYKNLYIEQDYKHIDVINYINEQNDFINAT